MPYRSPIFTAEIQKRKHFLCKIHLHKMEIKILDLDLVNDLLDKNEFPNSGIEVFCNRCTRKLDLNNLTLSEALEIELEISKCKK